VFLLLVPFQRGHFESSDELGVFETTRSLAERGSLDIPAITHTYVGRGGRSYSQYAVGQSILALPFYGLGWILDRVLPESLSRAMAGGGHRLRGKHLGGSVEAFGVGLYAPLATGVLVAVFFVFQGCLGVSPSRALLCSLLLGTCTYVATQATFFLRHTTEAAAILGGFYCLARYRQTDRTGLLALASLLLSSLLLIRLPAAVAGLPMAMYLGFVMFEKRVWRRGDRMRLAGAAALPFLTFLGLHMLVNTFKWGTPFESPMLAERSRFAAPLHTSLHANLFSPGMSVFVFSPLLALAPWTLVVFFRRHRAEAFTAVGLFVVFLLFFSAYEGWPGLWSAPGPRYLLATVPLLMLPLGLWLDEARRPLAWIAVILLAGAGLLVQLAFMGTWWSGIITTAGYPGFEPEWGFLFLPEESPLAAALRTLKEAPLHPWIVRLAQGRPGQAAAPGAVAVLGTLWATALGFVCHGLWRRRRTSGTQETES
jgi:hypothetical protein